MLICFTSFLIRDLERHVIDVILEEGKSDVKGVFLQMFDSLLLKIKSQSMIGTNVFDTRHHFDIGDIVDVIKHYLRKWPSGFHDIAGIKKEDEWKVVTDKVITILDLVVNRYSSNIHLWLLLIKVKFQLNEISEAGILLNRCMSIHPNSGLPFLMKAQIQLKGNDVTGSQQSLERALSEDFGIRNHPLYSFVKGSISLRKVRNMISQKIKFQLSFSHAQDTNYEQMYKGNSRRGKRIVRGSN